VKKTRLDAWTVPSPSPATLAKIQKCIFDTIKETPGKGEVIATKAMLEKMALPHHRSPCPVAPPTIADTKYTGKITAEITAE
jgi:hypothetical protein